MEFIYEPGELIKGKCIYADDDKQFGFEVEEQEFAPEQHGTSAALIIGKTGQLEFLINDGRALYLWGYLPKEAWQPESEGSLKLRDVKAGIVRVAMEDMPEMGVAYETDLSREPARYFAQSGHIVIGRIHDVDKLVEIATDTIIGLKGRRLWCLVLRPEMMRH